MSGISDNLKIWLERVVTWQDDNSLRSFCEQLKASAALVDFLQQLLQQLVEMQTVEQAVGSLPTTGQLLGRLCCLPMILCTKDCYHILMKCVLFYWTENPHNSLEAKAKDWALSQIRSMVCQTAGYFSNGPADTASIVLTEFHRTCLQQVQSTLSSFGRQNQAGRTWHHDLGCMVSLFPVTTNQLVDVCRLCLHLRHLEEFSQLLHEGLSHIQQCSDAADGEAVQRLCLEMAEVKRQQHSGTPGAQTLSYQSQVFLWRHHWPSLEVDILDFVESVLNAEQLDEEQIGSMLEALQLPRACSEHPELLLATEAVLGLVEQRLRDQSATRLASLRGRLRQCVSRCIRESDCEGFVQAVSDVSNLGAPPTKEEFAMLYGLFKQAVAGDCTAERPEDDYVAQTQYDAWYQMKGTDREEAVIKYIHLARLMKEKYGLNT